MGKRLKNACKVADYEKAVAKGRGQGRFDEYRPYFNIREVCSQAIRTRFYVRRFNHLYQLMSYGEVLALMILDWDERNIEVREQYPLEPNITLKLAKQYGIKHPGYTQGYTVMTTDFLVTRVVDGRQTLRAFQIKYDKAQAEEPRTREKLQLEELYWKQRNVPWCVTYTTNFNQAFCRNLELIAPFRNHRYEKGLLIRLKEPVLELTATRPYIPYTESHDITLNVAGELWPLDEALRALLGAKLITCPIKERELLTMTLADFSEK